MSRPDYRLNSNPTMLTATIAGTGELIPRSGDNRIAVTDISYKGFRPVVLRQDSLAGNATTGITSKHFLGVPVEGSSNFKSPVISDAGVSIYNATESAVKVGQNPVTDKVLLSVNYYYFQENGSYFDTDLRIRFRLNLVSRSLTKAQMESKFARVTLTKQDTSQVNIIQTGLGFTERTFYSDSFNLTAGSIPIEINTNSNAEGFVFRGNNLPVDGVGTYPNDEINGSLRYVIEDGSVSSTQYLGDIRLYKDYLQEGITYTSREIFVDITTVLT